jgi:hypothetical protein
LKPQVHYDERIYEADLRRLLQVSEEIEDEQDPALLVGHNPGLEELRQFLTGQSRRMPTAALVKITIEGQKWSRVGGKASLDWLVTPKGLKRGLKHRILSITHKLSVNSALLRLEMITQNLVETLQAHASRVLLFVVPNL